MRRLPGQERGPLTPQSSCESDGCLVFIRVHKMAVRTYEEEEEERSKYSLFSLLLSSCLVLENRREPKHRFSSPPQPKR